MAGLQDYSDAQMADATIRDVINSFIALRAREWQREQRRTMLGLVFALVAYERSQGREPDTRKIIEKIWLKHQLSLPALEPK
ncbi:MAG TPA: hypothetical protein VIM34_04820 [Burkholderiaceae bacterium]